MLTSNTLSFYEKTLGALFLVLSFQASAMAATYYISPTGNDNNTGTSETQPWKTFSKAFSTMGGGNELILLDGNYSVEAGTGYISNTEAGSGQPPSGLSVSSPTYVHAKNPGNVTITGRMLLGTSSTKKSYIKIQGITFEGGGALYNTSYVTIKDSGFHQSTQSSGSVFGIGTIDHNNGNTYNLIEDVWVWGNTRVIAINYRADYNVWRRVLVRGDGCSVSGCTGSGNPNVGLTVYNSSYVSVQNSMVVDRILDGGEPYANFAAAQHTPSQNDQGVGEYLGPNVWLGCISLKSPDAGFYFEADNVNDNTITIRNSVAWDSRASGFNMGTATLKNIMLENLTSGLAANNGIRLATGVTGTVRNVVVYNASTYGINSAAQPTYSNVYGSGGSAYNQTTCSTGCKTTNPLADGTPPSIKYITRVETGSSLESTGFNGGNYGANVVYRYGLDGTRYGETGYDTPTTTTLWPWPNESRIKMELCASSNRGFCLASSLSAYVWDILGNPMPSDIGGTTPMLSAPASLRIMN
ncbi:MAG: DUF1565 domain-containing protein [Candidatus Competibacter sp.]